MAYFSLIDKNTFTHTGFSGAETLALFLWGRDFNDYVLTIFSDNGHATVDLDMLPKNYDDFKDFLNYFQ